MHQAFNKYKTEVLDFLSDISKDIEALGGYEKAIIVHMRRDDAINVESVNKELENLVSYGERVLDLTTTVPDREYAIALNKSFDFILAGKKFEVSDL